MTLQFPCQCSISSKQKWSVGIGPVVPPGSSLAWGRCSQLCSLHQAGPLGVASSPGRSSSFLQKCKQTGVREASFTFATSTAWRGHEPTPNPHPRQLAGLLTSLS